MFINFENLSNELFKILKGAGYYLTLYNKDGKQIYDPKNAERIYVKQLKMMVSIIDDDENSKVNLSLPKYVKINNIKKLINSIKSICNKYNIIYEIKAYEKELTPKNFSYQYKSLDESKYINSKNNKRISEMTKIDDEIANLISSENFNIKDFLNTIGYSIDWNNDFYHENPYDLGYTKEELSYSENEIKNVIKAYFKIFLRTEGLEPASFDYSSYIDDMYFDVKKFLINHGYIIKEGRINESDSVNEYDQWKTENPYDHLSSDQDSALENVISNFDIDDFLEYAGSEFDWEDEFYKKTPEELGYYQEDYIYNKDYIINIISGYLKNELDELGDSYSNILLHEDVEQLYDDVVKSFLEKHGYILKSDVNEDVNEDVLINKTYKLNDSVKTPDGKEGLIIKVVGNKAKVKQINGTIKTYNFRDLERNNIIESYNDEYMIGDMIDTPNGFGEIIDIKNGLFYVKINGKISKVDPNYLSLNEEEEKSKIEPGMKVKTKYGYGTVVSNNLNMARVKLSSGEVIKCDEDDLEQYIENKSPEENELYDWFDKFNNPLGGDFEDNLANEIRYKREY